jgi:hypothetical protein
MHLIAQKINVLADRHGEGLPAAEAALVDSSADVIMGTPTFFLLGIGVAQLVVTTLD